MALQLHDKGWWQYAENNDLFKVVVMKKLFNRKGFTLTELMIIVIIIGVAAALAYPNFGKAVARLRIRNSARHMVSMMRLARSQAITNKVDVGVNFEEDGSAMTMFVNSSNPDFNTLDAGDSVLSVDSLPQDFLYIYGSPADAESGGGSAIVYKPNGSASSSTYFHFLATNGDDALSWGLIEVLGATGRTKLTYFHSY